MFCVSVVDGTWISWFQQQLILAIAWRTQSQMKLNGRSHVAENRRRRVDLTCTRLAELEMRLTSDWKRENLMKPACVGVVGGMQGSWHAPQFAAIKLSTSLQLPPTHWNKDGNNAECRGNASAGIWVVKPSCRIFSGQINGSLSCEWEITTRHSDENH